MVSADARARPIAHRAAFEAQIPTEVLRQDENRMPVHHEGDAGKTALPIPRRTIDRPQDRGRQSTDCRGAANASERQQPDRLILEECRSTVSRRSRGREAGGRLGMLARAP
jgi:hypothetical protein